MTDQYHIFAIGNALVDHEYVLTDEQLLETSLQKGHMTLVSHEEQEQLLTKLNKIEKSAKKLTGGGSAANTAFAAACLGTSAYYTCRVGNDALGKFYLEDLNTNGVTTSDIHSISENGATGSCVVCISEDGERTMQTHLGVSGDINADNINFDALPQAEWLYFEGYVAMSSSMNSMVYKLRDIAQSNNVKIAVSFSDPVVVNFAKEGLERILGTDDTSINNQLIPGVDVLFCNAEEAALYSGNTDLEATISDLLNISKIVVITLGSDGAMIAEKLTDGSIHQFSIATPKIDSNKAKVVDTNGAGDNFSGAFLAALTLGYSLEEAAKLSSHVATAVVTQFGARLDKESYQAVAKKALNL